MASLWSSVSIRGARPRRRIAVDHEFYTLQVVDNRRLRGPSPSRTAAGAAALSVQRAHVLEALQGLDGTVTAAQLADHLDLHVNTVREHLDALVARNLAVRGLAAPSGRGRPAHTYLAAQQTEHDARVRDYVGLATALAGQIARTSQDPTADAQAAGQAWAAQLLTADPAPAPARAGTRNPHLAARRRVVTLLAELGFDPSADRRARSVALRRCPLLDAARRHSEVVCGVHLGIVQGTLHLLGADPQHTDLQPFAEPGACRLTLTIDQ
jgi:predicted ArsR family transcriptional regulator